jgi:ferredoxin
MPEVAGAQPTPPPATPPQIAPADLRRFHLRGPADGDPSLPAGLGPALLERLREPERVRGDWPLLLPVAPGGAAVFAPLPDALKGALDRAAGPDGARELRDNLARVERRLHASVDGRGGSVEARAALAGVERALRDELALKPESDQRLAQDFQALAAALPERSRLLGFSPTSAVVLLLRAAESRLAPARGALRAEARTLAQQLRGLLDVEAEKARSREPEALRGAVDTIGTDLVDPQRLAEVLGPQRGTVRMEPERERRIRDALAGLERVVGEEGGPWAVFVHDGALEGTALDGEEGWRTEKAVDPCAAALVAQGREAARWTDAFRSLRVARLEVAGRFDPLRHVPFLAEFGPDVFSREEMALLPVVAAVDSADRIAGGGMVSLSRLLRSGRPVHALVPVDAARNPGSPRHEPLAGHRLELGYFGIGHRTAFVQQSSAARPAHLVEGFLRALAVPRPSLHVLAGGSPSAAESGPAPWLLGSAALESRAHPFFRYDPEAGSTWAGRMDFSGNPDPEEDWPVREWSGPGDGGGSGKTPLPFTFADFALMDPILAVEFRVVPDGVGAEDVAPLAEWLALPEEEAARKVPFVQGVDAQGAARRVAVTRALAAACRERLDFWHTLQELAGIRNEYVQEAVRAALADAALRHREELEIARRDAAGVAMQALARRLLDLDVAAPLAAQVAGTDASAAATAAPSAPPSAGDAPAAAKPAAAEAPWIDSALCTTCNECININPQLFVYNANKQARIADPKAGTFQQLVRAAEKCPAKCIHPGDPLNPSEPNLEALKKRAAVFR